MNTTRRHVGLVLGCLLAAVAAASPVAAEPLEIERGERWAQRAFFSESDVRIACFVKPIDEEPLVARWRLAAAGRTLARGEAKLDSVDGQPAKFEAVFKSPRVRDGVVLSCELRIDVGPAGGEPLGERSETLWVYPQDAFATRRSLFESNKLLVFDPVGDTIARLEEERVPHTRATRIPSPKELKAGVLLIGEGVGFDKQPALRRRLGEVAAQGGRVLGLRPSAGGFPIANAGEDIPTVHLLSVDSLARRHKRLDVRRYAHQLGPPTASCLSITTRRESPWLEIINETPAWPWCEINYAEQDNHRHGRLIVVGFPVIETWSTCPTPRYLFAKTLTTLCVEEPTANQLHSETP